MTGIEDKLKGAVEQKLAEKLPVAVVAQSPPVVPSTVSGAPVTTTPPAAILPDIESPVSRRTAPALICC